MKKFLSILNNNWPSGLIVITTLIVSIVNYTPNTWLTGWDNLHPEFDFKLNIYRSLFAVWQEYQGVGLLGGMAHASDLIHQILLWGASLILPLDLLRYAYHFLMIAVGMFGVYALLDRLLLAGHTPMIRKTSAVLGAIFYLLNLGTIQYFFVPFEPYSTFWGMFPWEIFTLLSFIKHQNKRSFGYFIIVNLLAVPQAYVQTIFLVYLLCVGLILGCFFFQKRSKAFLKTAALCLGAIFIINAFWLLPNLYSVVTNLHITQDAMQNHMATEKFFQMNKARGTIYDLPLLREFYYDFFDFNNSTNSFTYLMGTWRDQFNSLPIMLIGYLLFGVVVLGILNNKKYRPVLLSLLLLCLVIFLSDTPGMSTLNSIFRSIPLINQILRNPFTKFIVPMVLLFGVGMGLGSAYLMDRVKNTLHYKLVIPVILGMMIIITTFPVFTGNLISPTMRVAIPKEYFELFSYLKKQDASSRIMNLPQGSFWGWYYYRFGIRGSGFLWYGTQQPILDRAFDVWSRENEDYYWQLSYALQKRDQRLFNLLLEKYQIPFVLFDQNILFADNINSIRYAFNQEELIRQNSKLTQVAQFGKIQLYKVALDAKPSDMIVATTNLPGTSTPKSSYYIDNSFAQLGIYQNMPFNEASSLHPFTGLFSNRTAGERPFDVTQSDNTSTLTTAVPEGTYSLRLPSYAATATQLPAKISAKINGATLSLDLTVEQPKIKVGSEILPNQVRHLQVNFTLPKGSKNQYLSINNNDYFHLKDITGNYKEVGWTYLFNADNYNYIRLYEGKPKTETMLAANSFNPAKNCGAQDKAASVSSITKDDSVILQATNTANCTVFSSPLIGLSNSLVHVSFEYQSSTDEYPQYCFYSQNQASCLNKKDIIRTGFANSFTAFNDYFESSTLPNDTGFFHLITEAQADEDKNLVKKLSYRNIQITAYSYISGTSLSLSGLRDQASDYLITIPKNSKLGVTIQTPLTSATYANPMQRNLFKKSALNYDTSLPGKFALSELSDRKAIQASAQNASSYILLRANNLTAENGYLLRLTSQHKSGFPFTLNVFTNQEYRSYIYTHASSSQDIQSNFYILPPLYPFDKGISLLLGSNSYNSAYTINNLFDASLLPLPFNYLIDIHLTRANNSSSRATVLPVNVNKHSLSNFTVLPPNEARFIILSQGHNQGWHAYSLSGNPGFFSTYFPFLFGKELTHHKVNSWENGWNIAKEDAGKYIVITYTPQVLEWLGGLLFVAGLVIYIVFIKRCVFDRKP